MKHKTITLFISLALLLTLLSPLAAAPPLQEGGQDYFIQADDWLSKLAEKFYGAPLAYPAIVEATNAKAAEDTSYTVITNPDVIEVGQKLFLPAAAEASSLLAQSAAPASLSHETVTVALNFSPPSLDPTTGVVSWNTLQLGLGETLARLNRNGMVEPWLAESWQQLNDLEWEIKLRPDVTFHDGKPVTAEAVKASLEYSIEKLPAAASLLKAETISATDPTTIQIKTTEPNPSLGSLLAHYNLVIFDAELAKTQPEQFAAKPNMTGPFVAAAFQKDSSLILTRNPTYWGQPAQVEQVEVQFIVDANTRTNALLSGQVDMAYQIPPEAVETVQQAGKLVKSISTGYQYFIILNVQLPQFAEKEVRQALSQAVDRTAISQQVLLGKAEPATGPISLIFPFALKEGYGYDPAQANTLLDQAGWVKGEDGIRAKGDQRLAFTLLTYPQRPELAQIGVVLQAQLAEVGVAVELRSTDQINDAIKAPDFQAALYANNTAPTGDPGVFLNNWYSPKGSSNWVGYDNPEITGLLDQLNLTTDPTRRTELASEIQQLVLEDAPHIFLVVPQFNIGLGERLKNYEPFPSDYYIIDNQLQVSQ
ncbi:MAG: ABC transporter substrate-binding protein [Anaerolineae bacterium]|nr:hypothetical protein [Anaerolineales bacterium]MCQ3972348.1 hypothetical protein [Anaerolineae bacterium]